MDITLEDVLGKNDKKYIRILRLLHLIEGVNKSIENSQKLNNALMIRQYDHLKKQYTQEFLEVLADYKMPIHFSEAA
jgi:hypothetical protein